MPGVRTHRGLAAVEQLLKNGPLLGRDPAGIFRQVSRGVTAKHAEDESPDAVLDRTNFLACGYGLNDLTGTATHEWKSKKVTNPLDRRRRFAALSRVSDGVSSASPDDAPKISRVTLRYLRVRTTP